MRPQLILMRTTATLLAATSIAATTYNIENEEIKLPEAMLHHPEELIEEQKSDPRQKRLQFNKKPKLDR